MTGRKKTDFKQGIFRPLHPEKMKGSFSVYRSSWELKAMMFFDLNSDILEWESESTPISYRDSATISKEYPLGKVRRYFPDFIIKYKHKDGSIKTAMIEVKPACQTVPPVKKSKITKRYLNEVKVYSTNTSKWDAARKYCEVRNWDFMILDEYALGIATRK